MILSTELLNEARLEAICLISRCQFQLELGHRTVHVFRWHQIASHFWARWIRTLLILSPHLIFVLICAVSHCGVLLLLRRDQLKNQTVDKHHSEILNTVYNRVNTIQSIALR